MIGPLARTVGDAALLLDVLTGNVQGDLHRPPPPEESFVTSASRRAEAMRIALSLNIPYSGAPASLDPEVGSAVGRIATALESLGHRVEPVEVPYGIWPGASIMPRGNGGVAEWIEQALRPLIPVARLAERAGHRRVGSVFKGFDVILTPTTAQPPLPIGRCAGLSHWETDKAIVAACPYAWPWNVLGWPGVNVPAGLTAAGLPLGAQLLGPANSEGRLLSLAAQLEESERWHERRPAPLSATS